MNDSLEMSHEAIAKKESVSSFFQQEKERFSEFERKRGAEISMSGFQTSKFYRDNFGVEKDTEFLATKEEILEVITSEGEDSKKSRLAMFYLDEELEELGKEYKIIRVEIDRIEVEEKDAREGDPEGVVISCKLLDARRELMELQDESVLNDQAIKGSAQKVQKLYEQSIKTSYGQVMQRLSEANGRARKIGGNRGLTGIEDRLKSLNEIKAAISSILNNDGIQRTATILARTFVLSRDDIARSTLRIKMEMPEARKSVEEIKKEMFEKAGERNKEEVVELINDVQVILREEKENGRGKLRGNIEAIKESENGEEYFIDEHVAYIPEGKQTVYIGDLHGDYDSLVAIVNDSKFIENMERGNKETVLVFMGDYVDRGTEDQKTIELLLDLKKRYSNNVVLNSGNHERRSVNMRYGFLESLRSKFDPDKDIFQVFKGSDTVELFSRFNNLFEELPGVTLDARGIIAVHGGIPNEDINNLYDLNRPEILEQMCWNDPFDGMGDLERQPNYSRGEGRIYFGKKPFERFLKATGAKLMFRSHEEVFEGKRVDFNDRCATVFSNGGESKASHYGGDKVKKPKYVVVPKFMGEDDLENWPEECFHEIYS